MGGKYLINEGFNKEVSLAVAEHYLPRFFKDKLPSSKYGAVLSMADKLETLISIFVIGKRPTGSSDPYALRRNLNGVIQIIWHFNLKINLENLICISINHWKKSVNEFDFDEKKVGIELLEFTKQRIISVLEEISIEKNWINAICNSNLISSEKMYELQDIKIRIDILNSLKEKNRFDKFKKIIARISKLANTGSFDFKILCSKGHVNPKLFEKDSENDLFKIINQLEDIIFSKEWKYAEIFNIIDENLEVIENIFDNDKGVLIICEEIDRRINRLNLLSLIRNYSLLVADFTLF